MLLCAGVTPPAMLRRANRDVDWAGMWEVGHGKWDGLTGYIRDVCLARTGCRRAIHCAGLYMLHCPPSTHYLAVYSLALSAKPKALG